MYMTMKLQEMRVKAGLTQKDLATRIGCTQSEISRIEHGERSISVDRLQQLAAALDVPAADLLGERRQVAA